MAITVSNDQLIKTITNVTANDAAQYQATGEKFTYCLDLLELSLTEDGDDVCDHWVQQLENKFETMLKGV